jgi:preprotein translocase subunit YajC
MSSLLYAADPATTAQANPITGFIPIILLFVVFYFFLIRPQQKKVKEHQKMVTELQKGDKIITAGGIYGVVDGFNADDQNSVYVKIADNTKVLVTRDSVATVLKQANTVNAEIVK